MRRQNHHVRLFFLPAAALCVLSMIFGLPGDSGTCSASEFQSPADAPRVQTLEAARPITGFSIVAHHISDLDLYLDSVDAIAAMGGNAVNIVTPMFQDTVTSTEISRPADRCPTDAQLRQIIERAESHGMFTALQPIVLMQNPSDGAWRGVLEPSDWSQWWSNYTGQIQAFVELASDTGVDLFCIGSELNFAESRIHRWEKLANRIQDSYEGQITYSANWDRFMHVRFWDALDVVSISAYFELHDETAEPTLKVCRRAWRNNRDRLLAFAERREQPLLLSEVGYPTLPWATREPWNYIAGSDVKADDNAKAAQATGYQALFDAWTAVIARPDTRAAGLFCYAWDPYYHGGPNDTGYGVRGKPAYGVVKKAFKAIHQTHAHAAGPSRQPREPDDDAKPGS